MKKTPKQGVLGFDLWCHLELNQGHTDFQSVALPAELWHPLLKVVQIYTNFSFDKTIR